MLSYELSDRAVRDLVHAREWYDRQGADLGNRFVDEALMAIGAARERPSVIPSSGGECAQFG